MNLQTYRFATKEDVPAILSLILELAEYEVEIKNVWVQRFNTMFYEIYRFGRWNKITLQLVSFMLY